MFLLLGLTAVLLGGELVGITLLVDTGYLVKAAGLLGFLGSGAAWGLRVLLLGSVLTAVFGILSPNFTKPVRRASHSLVSPRWTLIHVISTPAFAVSSYFLCQPGVRYGAWLMGAAVCSGIVSIASGLLVFLPVDFWRALIRAAPWAPVYGFLTGACSVLLVKTSTAVSLQWRAVTFQVVSEVLRRIVPAVQVDRENFVLGPPSFQVELAPQCSGYEGVALMLIFAVAWLLVFRREFRFPHALLLIPLGMGGMWILNCVRVVVLLLIGIYGAPGIAVGGFHSQAGWIAFVTLAISSAVAWQRVPWVLADVPGSVAPPQRRVENPTTAYLLPFLAILSAGMLAQAASSGFEWLYPMRVLAAGAALWTFRRSYAALGWRAGREAVGLGALVALLWVGADYLGGPHVRTAMPAALAAAPALWRVPWMAFRVAGAMITVPIAEELAFRGFLLRRLVGEDFTAVSLRTWTPVALGVSSVLFGVMHGGRWAAGIAAGVLYAWAMHRRGRIGDAVAAHAVTNLILALAVLFTGDWGLW
jgi:exosortase E/protease (VPEID-CTERM system)